MVLCRSSKSIINFKLLHKFIFLSVFEPSVYKIRKEVRVKNRIIIFLTYLFSMLNFSI
jgi:hypothetical protein